MPTVTGVRSSRASARIPTDSPVSARPAGSSSPAGRPSYIETLELAFVQAQEAGREDVEDAIADLLDRVTGWCNPRLSLASIDG